MDLHTLKSFNKKKKTRVGRGDGSGRGTYSGRGMKGQSSRAGGRRRPGFEGGQTPLTMRMPKLRGFKSPNKVTYQVVNVADLEATFKAGDKVTKEMLAQAKLVFKANGPVKLLGNGEITKALEVTVDLASKSAVAKIEKAKGKVNVLEVKKEKVEKPAKKKKAKKEVAEGEEAEETAEAPEAKEETPAEEA